jgi:hypothetical protein
MKCIWEVAGIITLILFLFVSLANGRTIAVGTGLGYDYATIQAAINAAQEGDTVLVAQGTYEEPVRFNGANIVLTSTDPNSWSVIGNTEIEFRDGSVVTFTGAEDESCVLQGFTITRGHSDGCGGGIFGNGTRATIRRCNINRNRAPVGGGLYDCDGLIEDCIIADNIRGGGICGCDGIINNCTVEDNKMGDDDSPIRNPGGGLYSCNGEIIGCTIRNNYATGKGGGLYACNGYVIDCIIRDNVSGDSGGGLSMCIGSIENCTVISNKSPYWHGGGAVGCNSLKNCVIMGNSTRGYGGGLYNCQMISGCTITGNTTEIYPGGGLSGCSSVTNCIISGNFSGGSGGGLHNCREVVNCTIVGNYSMEKGGAIHYCGNYGNINNSIIWDNIGIDVGQIFVECDEPNSALWNLSIDHSNIQGGLESVIVGAGSTLQWESNNIDIDPFFVLPGTWTNEDLWLEGDYHLLFGSPCIDAGDPNKDYTGQTDIDGRERVFGQYVDIGADEYVYVEPAFEELAVEGPQEVTEGDAAQYTAIARYDNDSEIDVTSEVIWTVEPEGIGTINTTGLFTIGELDVSVEVIIKAEYIIEQVLYAAHRIVLCRPLPEPPTIYHVDTVTGNDENDGLSHRTALKTIQTGINAAQEGETVLVYPGIYRELILFRGKAITLKSAEDAAIIENPNNFAVLFCFGEGRESVIQNFVIRNSLAGIFVVGSSPTIKNLTVVNNDYGIECFSGEPDVSNCILWNNSEVDLAGCGATFSCIKQDSEGIGNISSDPLFVNADNGDFHLRSEQGRYWPMYNIWVLDEVTSPCIDKGNPVDDCSNEREPNSGRINMGAYGGTPQASMSLLRP